MNWKKERTFLLLVFRCRILDFTCIILLEKSDVREIPRYRFGN